MFKEKLNRVLLKHKTFAADPLNLAGLLGGLVVNIIHWLLLYFKLSPGGENILLHYNVIYGSDFIGPSVYAYGLPAISLILLFINWVLAHSFYKREKLPAYFLSFGTLAIQLVFLAATIVLITINA